jgi:hypothetical protein
MELLKILKEDKFGEIDEILDKRSFIIEALDKKQNSKFKELYVKSDVFEIDKELKNIFSEKISNIKNEIKTQKKIKQVNYSYIKTSKENLNIFNEKI